MSWPMRSRHCIESWYSSNLVTNSLTGEAPGVHGVVGNGFFLSWVRGRAAEAGASRILARYKPGARNVQMRSLFRLSGLNLDREDAGGTHIYAGPCPEAASPPRWLTVREEVD